MFHKNHALDHRSNSGLQAFEKHIAKVHQSKEFEKKAKAAQPFLNSLKDYVFGRPTTLENIVSFTIQVSTMTQAHGSISFHSGM